MPTKTVVLHALLVRIDAFHLQSLPNSTSLASLTDRQGIKKKESNMTMTVTRKQNFHHPNDIFAGLGPTGNQTLEVTSHEN